MSPARRTPASILALGLPAPAPRINCLIHYLGIGAETSFRFRRGPYAGLDYRPRFYDFNVIVQPALRATRFVPEMQAGLGGAKLTFYYSQPFCSIFGACQISSSHFQLHAAGGLRVSVTQHVFIRPQIDVHWVHHFSQFGSNVVPQYGVAIGYTFGR